MAGRRASRDAITREQWAAVIAASKRADAHREDEIRPAARRGRVPISRGRIVEAALGAIAAIGYDRLTMRTVADALDTGPASLYAHVRNKAQLGDLLVGELCSRIDLPEPDPARGQGEDVHGEVVDRAEIAERLKMLPVEQFHNTVAFARELTAGEGHDRFDHTLPLMMRGLSSS